MAQASKGKLERALQPAALIADQVQGMIASRGIAPAEAAQTGDAERGRT